MGPIVGLAAVSDFRRWNVALRDRLPAPTPITGFNGNGPIHRTGWKWADSAIARWEGGPGASLVYPIIVRLGKKFSFIFLAWMAIRYKNVFPFILGHYKLEKNSHTHPHIIGTGPTYEPRVCMS